MLYFFLQIQNFSMENQTTDLLMTMTTHCTHWARDRWETEWKAQRYQIPTPLNYHNQLVTSCLFKWQRNEIVKSTCPTLPWSIKLHCIIVSVKLDKQDMIHLCIFAVSYSMKVLHQQLVSLAGTTIKSHWWQNHSFIYLNLQTTEIYEQGQLHGVLLIFSSLRKKVKTVSYSVLPNKLTFILSQIHIHNHI